MTGESQGPGHGGPARGYRWEDAKPGNMLALKHGAYSPRKVDPVAADLVQAVLDEPDTAYLQQPSYLPALWAWARAEARIRILEEWLEAHASQGGVLDVEGELLPAVRLLERVEKRAETLRGRLGLDPLSRAKLGRDEAAARVDFAQLIAQMREDDDA